jgi:VWFA-related protein
MNPRLTICTIVLAWTLADPCLSQQPTPTPPDPSPPVKSATRDEQGPIKIVIEEVQIPVAAYDQYGHLDPTLNLDDILVIENGVPQQVRSARRSPASVLLLLDTGGDINPAKTVRVTRAIARNLVSALSPNDQVSVIQFNHKVELLQDWTSNVDQVAQVLETKLLSGKRAHLSTAVSVAVDQFRTQPVGSRHLVLITDGVEAQSTKPYRAAAMTRLMASNAVVHVLSYTAVSWASTKEARRVITKREKSTTPDSVVETLPDDPGYSHLRRLHKPGGINVDLDPERRRQIEAYEEAMRESELLLMSLSSETGGHMWLPESLQQMIDYGAEVARLIDAGYIVTYRPSRSLAASREGEVRRIEVVSRRVGLNIASRRSYVVGATINSPSERRTGEVRPRTVVR